MSIFNDFSPQTLMIIGIIVVALFLVVVFVVLRDSIILYRARKDQQARINGLLLSNMIQRLNIPFRKYTESTTDLEKEKHIWSCQRCHDLGECESMFLGKETDPQNFCPNFDDLKKIKET